MNHCWGLEVGGLGDWVLGLESKPPITVPSGKVNKPSALELAGIFIHQLGGERCKVLCIHLHFCRERE